MKFLPTLLFLVFFAGNSTVFAASDDVEVELFVPGCNNNTICEPIAGENINSCPLDCTATTPTTTPPVSGGGGGSSGGGSIVNPYVLNIQVVPAMQSAVISWYTNRLALASLMWGATSDFEKGTVTQVTFKTEHTQVLTNLLPGTVYYFKITATDLFGRRVESPIQFFHTLSLPGYELPSNVTGAHAIPGNGGILLLWKNPLSPYLNNIRILRSTYYYPRDPFDGRIVYEAKGEAFTDTNVKKDAVYYYSIFTRNVTGEYSSGVTLRAKSTVGLDDVSPFDFGGDGVIFNTPQNNIPSVPGGVGSSSTSYFGSISLSNFIFIQNGKEVLLSPSGGAIVNADQPFVISIKKELFSVPPDYITFHIQDTINDRNYYSYLMRLNPDRGVYEAYVSALNTPGNRTFLISTVNSRLKVSRELTGRLELYSTEAKEREHTPFSAYMYVALITGSFLFLFWIFRRFIWGRKDHQI